MLTPRESTTWKLYGSHAHPLTRVVHGVPMSWDTDIAAATRPYDIEEAVCSPCNRFIAITWLSCGAVDILDSVTLQLLQTLKYHQKSTMSYWVPAFSPDSRILTITVTRNRYQDEDPSFISWDLQTGGISSIGRRPGPGSDGTASITYSVDGKLVGICAYYYPGGSSASIYDVASGVLICSQSLEVGKMSFTNLSPHGESFQFASIDALSITIWEVGHPHVEVETLLAPDCIGDRWPHPEVQLLLTLRRVAIVFNDGVFVWDARNSEYLLHKTDTKFNKKMSFSSDGRFLACQTTGSEVYLWKESPAGYVLHNILLPRTTYSGQLQSSTHSGLLLYQNGESIVTLNGHTIQLWHTKGFPTSTSSVLAQASQHMRNFILDFSPDGELAVFAMWGTSVVTVLDLKSGVLNLTIIASINVWGIRVIGSTVVVIGDWHAQHFYLPTRDSIPDQWPGLEDNSWSVNITKPSNTSPIINASISPDCHDIAFVGNRLMFVCGTSTSDGDWTWGCPGEVTAWFADEGYLWCADNMGVATIWDHDYHYVMTLDKVHPSPSPPAGYPWGSSYGYQVTDDWWMLGPDGKRLLMLPPPWQSDPVPGCGRVSF